MFRHTFSEFLSFNPGDSKEDVDENLAYKNCYKC